MVQYEAPVIIDAADLAGAVDGCTCCTGGSAVVVAD